jgi:5-methylcytosine-specific restriction protein A
MADLHGQAGEGVIHVHHLRELAKVGAQYKIDPISDLRPACPNCHAILHTVSPAMTIERLRDVLAGQKPIQWPSKPE